MSEAYLTTHFGEKDSAKLDFYLSHRGYESARRAIGSMTPSEVVQLVKDSGLRGRGGAGFSTGLKWSFMPKPGQDDRPRYIACNADESEPGTFKDRAIMERDPHQLIEGLIIAGWAMQAKAAYIYIRGEYVHPARVLEAALREAYDGGYLGPRVMGTDFAFDVYLHRGAGAYICGEETGLMESLEGKKGQPRKKPPFPANYGLWGMPTTVNNVETFCHVVHVVDRGIDWFRGIGTEKSTGTTLFGVSGHVVRPGYFELPLGTTAREIIFEHAGGIANGRQLKGFIPGGSSTKPLPASAVDVRMDHDSLAAAGSALGTAGLIVMDDTTCMVRASKVIAHFYRDESCGQCTQCREGTAWLDKLIGRIEAGAGRMEDLDLLLDVANSIEGVTICALSDAAAWPVQGVLKHWRDEFARHVKEGKCPFPESFEV
ncbi:MAG: NADH-quinone oxidoreductase subunit NuoF [Deltaproteobacteria bacterium]|nr:NADH-quinone oxidoreductase subunit NuoF [Deltaproteobacteria bacterium]